ncbi:MAG: DciA family protein, partial [Oricola sp.]
MSERKPQYGPWKAHAPEQIGGLVSTVLDPVLAQRAGMTSALLSAWPQIVPTMLSETTRPHKINWPRRASEDDPFKPAVLIVAAEGMAALHLQHQTGEIIQRVNAFFGFQAVERLQIVQK